MEFTGERFIPGEHDNELIGLEHWQRYLSVKEIVKNKTVLDIACGEGYGSNFIAQTASFVYGVDIDKNVIDYACNKYKRENLCFKCGSVNKIEMNDASIDIVVSFETIEHVETEVQKSFLTEVKRVLKKDGIFIVSSPNKAIATDWVWEVYKYKNEFHKKEFYIEEFHVFLKSYFNNIELFYQRNETALILNSEYAKSLDIILNEGKNYNSTQNIIAICCNNSIEQKLCESIVFEKVNTYQTNNAIIQDLRNFLDILKNENIEAKKINGALEESIVLYSEANSRMEVNNLDLKAENELLKSCNLMLKEKNTQIETLYDNLVVKNKNLENLYEEGKKKNIDIINEMGKMKIEIEDLYNIKSDLQKIYNSKGWKFLKILYNIKAKLQKNRDERVI